MKYVFPKNKKLKRHRFSYRAGGFIVCRCGEEFFRQDCHPMTTNPEKYANKPCKKCEK